MIRNIRVPTKMLDAAAFGIPSVTNSGTPMGELCLNEKFSSAVWERRNRSGYS